MRATKEVTSTVATEILAAHSCAGSAATKTRDQPSKETAKGGGKPSESTKTTETISGGWREGKRGEETTSVTIIIIIPARVPVGLCSASHPSVTDAVSKANMAFTLECPTL